MAGSAGASVTSSRPSTLHRYKGLFTPRHAPTARAYCILFSFTGGIVLITTGSVFCSVIARHPVSGGRPMHTPPLPLAVSVIVAGVLMIFGSVVTAWRYGMDDGDSNLEDDGFHFCSEDELDRIFQQEVMVQQYIERQIHIERQKLHEEQRTKEQQQPCCVHCKSSEEIKNDSNEFQNSLNSSLPLICDTSTAAHTRRPSISVGGDSGLAVTDTQHLECSCDIRVTSAGGGTRGTLYVRDNSATLVKHSSKIIANNNEISVVIDDS